MKKQVLILAIAIATTMTSFAQDMAVTYSDDLGQVEMEALDITREWAINYTPSVNPDQISWASFPGGKEAMFEFLGSKGKVDMDAVNSGEQCVVYVKFTVNTDGSISDIHVTSNDWKALNTSAMDTIKGMPTWNPTKKGDSVVKTEVILPLAYGVQRV